MRSFPMQDFGSGRSRHSNTASTDTERLRFRDIVPSLLLLLIGISALVVATLLSASPSGQYIVITAPGSSLAQTFSVVVSAQGGVVKTGRYSNIVVAASPHADFAQDLRHAGAWLVINPAKLSGCYGTTAS